MKKSTLIGAICLGIAIGWAGQASAQVAKEVQFSGTGKYIGMQGTMDWVLRFPKPFPEGTGRGICREVVKIASSQN